MNAAPTENLTKRFPEGRAGIAIFLQEIFTGILSLITAGDPQRGSGPSLHDASEHLGQKLWVGDLAVVIAEKGQVDVLSHLQRPSQDLVDVVVGEGAVIGSVEQVDDLSLVGGKMGDGIPKGAGPSRWRPQKPSGEVLPGVGLGEEAGAHAVADRAAEHGVDDGVEGDVVDDVTPGEETGVPEDHVVELVEDEQEEIAVIAAEFVEEFPVEQESGRDGALDAGRRGPVAEIDVEQAEELLHLVGGGRQDIEDPVPDGGGLGRTGFVGEEVHGRVAIGSSKAMGRARSVSHVNAGALRERYRFPAQRERTPAQR